MSGVMAGAGGRRSEVWKDRLVALLLMVVVAASLQGASRSLGIPRDEAIYFNAAEQQVAYYGELLGELSRGRLRALWDARLIDRHFSSNREHPPLMKTLFGVSWRVLHRCNCPAEAGYHPLPYPQRHRTLGLLSGSQAMRLPAHLLWGVLIGAVYLVGVRLGGRLVGLLAAGMLVAMPRAFFHAQLACFDAPVAAMIFLITAAYLRAQAEGGWRWAGIAGVLLGLGLATKHNTYFLGPVLLLHSLWVRRERVAGLGELSGGAKVRRVLGYVLQPWAVAMGVLGPGVLLLLWPHLWPNPGRRFVEYVGFHLHHVHYNIEYLGTNYNLPPYPWHYVPVMTLFTVPVTGTVLALVGAWVLFGKKTFSGLLGRHGAGPVACGVPAAGPREPSLRRHPLLGRHVAGPVACGVPAAGQREPSLRRHPLLGGQEGGAAPGDWGLVGVSLLWPMLVIMRPGTPIFGAEKHWMPAMPFLALLAGMGLLWAVRRAVEALGATAVKGWAVGIGALVVVLLGPLLEVRRSLPYGLSHYNALAGGTAGAATLGTNRQFWGYSARGVWPFVNSRPGGRFGVYFHDASLQVPVCQREGMLRRDVYDSGLEEPGVRGSDLAMVVLEKHFNKYEYWIWDAYGTTRPSYVLTHEGVPLVTVYERPGGQSGAGAVR